MTNSLRWKRILLKLSGEALMGSQAFGIDPAIVQRIAKEIADAVALGAQVGVVVGGGNIFRGVAVAAKGGNRVTGDHMGMLATIMNSLTLADALRRLKVNARVLSAVSVPSICETFSQRVADRYMEDGDVIVFAGGTGNPFFTTDSGAALRAAEMKCDAFLKGTQVDGVYSEDPKLVTIPFPSLCFPFTHPAPSSVCVRKPAPTLSWVTESFKNQSRFKLLCFGAFMPCWRAPRLY